MISLVVLVQIILGINITAWTVAHDVQRITLWMLRVFRCRWMSSDTPSPRRVTSDGEP